MWHNFKIVKFQMVSLLQIVKAFNQQAAKPAFGANFTQPTSSVFGASVAPSFGSSVAPTFPSTTQAFGCKYIVIVMISSYIRNLLKLYPISISTCWLNYLSRIPIEMLFVISL